MNQNNESTSDGPLNQILAEYLQAVEAGQPPDEEKLLEQHPEFAGQLQEFFADKRRVDQIAKTGPQEDQIPRPRAAESVKRLAGATQRSALSGSS